MEKGADSGGSDGAVIGDEEAGMPLGRAVGQEIGAKAKPMCQQLFRPKHYAILDHVTGVSMCDMCVVHL